MTSVGKSLAERWRERLVEGIDHAILRRVSRFDKRYFEFLQVTLRHIDTKGLPTVGEFTPELADVFVDVSLAPRPPGDVSGDVLADVPNLITERLSIWSFLKESKPQVLAVLGSPGSGKTTLLRHLAQQLSVGRGMAAKQIPILIELRDHVPSLLAEPHASLEQVLKASLREFGESLPAGWLKEHLRKGRCTVLFDGLDEVASDDGRRGVSAWIQEQIGLYPLSTFVVTSRPQGYRSAPILGALVLQVRGFSPKQVRTFLSNWYRVSERRSTGRSDEATDRHAEQLADDLLVRLRDSPALWSMTVNPLLLTMIAQVHRYRGALPGSRAELYSEVCQVMLWRRQEAKRLPSASQGLSSMRLLALIAHSMMVARVSDIDLGEIEKLVGEELPRLSVPTSSHEFVLSACNSGLILEREQGIYAFSHQTFQEYLAANHMKAHSSTLLSQAVDDSWWRETTLLFVSGGNADPIVRACLSSGSVAALALAFECLDVCDELDPELRQLLQDIPASALRSAGDSDRRELVAQIHVKRLMNSAMVLESGVAISGNPVSEWLYAAYIAETDALAPDQMNTRSPSNTPARGMWPDDVIPFFSWLNRIGADQDRGILRLPTKHELAALPWLASGDHPSPVWTAEPKTGKSVHIYPQKLSEWVVSDFELKTAVADDLSSPYVRLQLLWVYATSVSQVVLWNEHGGAEHLAVRDEYVPTLWARVLVTALECIEGRLRDLTPVLASRISSALNLFGLRRLSDDVLRSAQRRSGGWAFTASSLSEELTNSLGSLNLAEDTRLWRYPETRLSDYADLAQMAARVLSMVATQTKPSGDLVARVQGAAAPGGIPETELSHLIRSPNLFTARQERDAHSMRFGALVRGHAQLEDVGLVAEFGGLASMYMGCALTSVATGNPLTGVHSLAEYQDHDFGSIGIIPAIDESIQSLLQVLAQDLFISEWTRSIAMWLQRWGVPGRRVRSASMRQLRVARTTIFCLAQELTSAEDKRADILAQWAALMLLRELRSNGRRNGRETILVAVE